MTSDFLETVTKLRNTGLLECAKTTQRLVIIILNRVMLSFDLLVIFGLLALLCSFLLIVSRNPIHSILYLILVFCNVSFIFIILNIEFIALTFLIVYVGAISVLFLFVIMMLNIKIIELDEVF